MARLVFRTGPRQAEGAYFTDSVVLGRGGSAEFDLGDRTVSRRHARVSRRGETFVVEDLDSGNGTFVNGRRVRQAIELRQGDRLKVGLTELEFLRGGGTRQATDEPSSRVQLADSSSQLEATVAIPLARISEAASLAPEEVVVRQLRERLEFFVDVGEMMARGLEEADLLDLLLARVLSAIKLADRAFILVCAGPQQQIVAQAARTRSGSAKEILADRALMRGMLARRQAVLLTDSASGTARALPSRARRLGVGSSICAPLVAGDTVHGVLEVDSLEGSPPLTSEDLATVAAIGTPIALAIANARLHLEVVGRELEQRDLALARDIQRRFLPHSLPAVPGYEFAAEYSPAWAIGGDLYDFLALPSGEIGIALGDVCGKGVPAALVMARLMSDLRVLAKGGRSGAVLVGLNELLHAEAASGMFATMLFAVLEPSTGRLEIANAGHPPPLLRQASGKVSLLGGTGGAALGVAPQDSYPTVELELSPGEVMLAFSDGLTEAADRRHRRFGIRRLRRAVSGAPAGAGAGELLSTVLGAASRFLAGSAYADDLTLVCVSRSGQPRA